MDSYLKFWKDTFDYKSSVNRKEFNLGFWPHLLMIALVFIIGPMLGLPKLGFDLKKPLFEMVLDLNWKLYHLFVLAIFLIPMITLMMRRCNELEAERTHGVMIALFPIAYMIYAFLFLIFGQGLPSNVLWVEIFYYIVLSLPLFYLIYMLATFALKKGKHKSY
ncbi:hypothetical protein [Macrococcoides caseolyticum]|uniref:hypothetical protein n=1 Tax=Macrococcoides caseolyticum TaxID=69966 RepID=UPI001F489C04|nr:hypothetical protein [Macrococcus caseolyticus]MCE4955989.1 hypothetical protein [Macrococcus caseolyticus]